ncbi:hypothetical protein [Rhodothalassium salexigens]|uniref:hypothetical protein n=1 Tax=Rhodothalassium salexigens TaxID=1086 RepID=UPI001F5BF3BD
MAETDASNEAAEPATLPEREERPDFSAVFRDADDDADAPAPDDPAPPGSATSDTIAADNATADRPSEPQQAGGAGPAGRPDMDPNSPFAALRQAVERSGSVDMAAERAAKAR